MLERNPAPKSNTNQANRDLLLFQRGNAQMPMPPSEEVPRQQIGQWRHRGPHQESSAWPIRTTSQEAFACGETRQCRSRSKRDRKRTFQPSFAASVVAAHLFLAK